MNDRNESMSATAAPYAAHGRVLVFVGRDHSGFLPNEHLPEAAPDETYPGLNSLFETKYNLPSIALAQDQIGPQGYLTQSASRPVGRFLSPISPPKRERNGP